jgi:pyruvate formate lyase activating enzyme
MPTQYQTARFQKVDSKERVVCGLCPHHCRLRSGETGICGTRQNVRGTLVVVTHGRLRAGGDDPIEKKPLFHYRPGSRTFSIATQGCNLACPFCQNHTLSTPDTDAHRTKMISPETVVETAAASGCESIAFTYSEPILMLEFAESVAPLAEAEGIELVFVTNGQATERAAKQLSGMLHAANVDIKCFSKKSYREILGGDLNATLRTIEQWYSAGVWIEITTLLIPGFNDGDSEITDIAKFILNLNPSIPWHISRFHSAHRWWDRAPTPPEALARAREIGLAEGLKFVYTGNVPGDDREKTRCPGCGSIVIDRAWYRVLKVAIEKARCISCGEQIAGRGLP